MNIREIPCCVCAYEEDANIGAAFVQISAGEKCYLQLSDAPNAIYASVKKGDRPLKAGDEILVQISREAMK